MLADLSAPFTIQLITKALDDNLHLQPVELHMILAPPSLRREVIKLPSGSLSVDIFPDLEDILLPADFEPNEPNDICILQTACLSVTYHGNESGCHPNGDFDIEVMDGDALPDDDEASDEVDAYSAGLRRAFCISPSLSKLEVDTGAFSSSKDADVRWEIL